MRNKKLEYRNTKQYQNSNFQNSKHFCFDYLNFCHSNLFRISCFGFRISIFLFLFFFFYPQSTHAQYYNYPISELNYCRDAKECSLYCQIPQNTPACWSYGKYVMNPDVLGETDININYPILELGNCNTAQDCFIYCSQPDNQQACAGYARDKGLVKNKPIKENVDETKIVEAAKTELGCETKEACMSFCDKTENREKCFNFSKKYNLGSPPGEGQQGPSQEVIQQMEGELGCDGASSCKNFCDQPVNREKCFEVAQKYGLVKKEEIEKREQNMEEMRKLLEEAKTELGCDTQDTCAKFCTKKENKEKCMQMWRKHNVGPQIPQPSNMMQPVISGTPPTKQQLDAEHPGPGGCTSDKACLEYCQKHPKDCPGFVDKKSQPNSANAPQPSPQASLGSLSNKTQTGTFLGPGGCKTEGECKAYCEKHPKECPGFPEKKPLLSPSPVSEKDRLTPPPFDNQNRPPMPPNAQFPKTTQAPPPNSNNQPVAEPNLQYPLNNPGPGLNPTDVPATF